MKMEILLYGWLLVYDVKSINYVIANKLPKNGFPEN